MVASRELSLRLGDPHRFGARVRQLAGDEGVVFFKPRSTLLEYLVVDPSSPLSPQSFLGYKPPCRITSKCKWEGISCDLSALSILSFERRNNSSVYCQRAGSLIALTTFLGITDLHHENILICEVEGNPAPVPIDLEVIFWDCISGMDTLLFPSSKVNRLQAGLTGQFDEEFFPSSPEIILDSYLESSEKLLPTLPELFSVLFRLLKGHPVRILLRSTRHYRDLLALGDAQQMKRFAAQSSDGPLLESEILQLSAGDIPYFFYFPQEKPKLHFFSKPEKIDTCSPMHFRNVFRQATPCYEQLINKKRVAKLHKMTALHICRAYSYAWRGKDVKGENFELSWNDGLFTLRTKQFHSRANV